MFTAFGTIATKLDSKNRLKIPARFKELLADYRKLYFYKGLDGVFYLDTKPKWEQIVQFIESKRNPFDPNYSIFATHFFNNACDLKVDDHDRVVLSARILELLKADKAGELIVQGVGESLTLWAKSEFDKHIKNTETTFEEAAKALFANGFVDTPAVDNNTSSEKNNETI